MNDLNLEPEPSDSKVLYSAIGWIGVICLFFLIVGIAYIPRQAKDEASRAAERRIAIRDQVLSEQARLYTAYEWVNQPEGVVRIPVERAIDLTVEELRAEQQANPGDTF